MLKRLWNGWKKLARRIGTFQAKVVLTIFYAILVLPLGLAVRWFADPLNIKRRPIAWKERPQEANLLESARRQ
jgi:hypothetical protein